MAFGQKMQLDFKILQLGILFIPLLFAFLIGFDRPATYVADLDLSLISEALRYNSNKPLIYFNQPIYFSVLILGWWLKFLHFFEPNYVFDIASLTSAPFPIEALQTLTINTRILSVIICECYLIAFMSLLKNIGFSKLIVISGGLILACSEGLLVQSITYRTEALSTLFITLALISLTQIDKLRSLNFLKVLFITIQTSIYGYFAAITNSISMVYFSLTFPLFFFLQKDSSNNLKRKNEGQLTLKYFLLTLLIFLFLTSNHQILSNEITLTKSIFAVSIFALIFLMYLKKYSKTSVLAVVLGVFVGLALAYNINYFRFNIQNHKFIINAFDHSKIFLYNVNTPEGDALYNVFLFNLQDCLKSKFSIRFILTYPIQLLFFVSLYFLVTNFIKRNWVRSLQIVLFMAAYILFETLTMQQNFLHFGKLPSDINYKSFTVYRIYIEFFLLLSYCIGIDHFIRIRNNKKIAIINLSIVSIFVSFFSFRNTYTLINENKLLGFSVRQDQSLVCSYLKYQANDIEKHLHLIANTCEDAMSRIELRK